MITGKYQRKTVVSVSNFVYLLREELVSCLTSSLNKCKVRHTALQIPRTPFFLYRQGRWYTGVRRHGIHLGLGNMVIEIDLCNVFPRQEDIELAIGESWS